jgi:hypothetical protein
MDVFIMLGDESDTTVTDDTDDEETIEVEESYETKVRVTPLQFVYKLN